MLPAKVIFFIAFLAVPRGLEKRIAAEDRKSINICIIISWVLVRLFMLQDDGSEI